MTNNHESINYKTDITNKPKSKAFVDGCIAARAPRSWYFKANDCRQFPYIDTSSLLSRQFPVIDQDVDKIMKFLCEYLNCSQAICFYVVLSLFFKEPCETKKSLRTSLQKRMRKYFKQFFGKDRLFEVGDISKVTNLLDAFGLIGKQYCAINGFKLANFYILNPVFRDPIFRGKILGSMAASFRGKTSYKFAFRLNDRYHTFGSYKSTVMSIWSNVRDIFMGLNPTHEYNEEWAAAKISGNGAESEVSWCSDSHFVHDSIENQGELAGVPCQSESVRRKMQYMRDTMVDFAMPGEYSDSIIDCSEEELLLLREKSLGLMGDYALPF